MNTRSLAQYQFEIGSRMSESDWAGATTLAAECRIAWPTDSSGWLFGSMAALFAQKKAEALALAEERLSLDPLDTQCLLQKAECLFALGERDQAIAAAEIAAASAPLEPAALNAVGIFLAHVHDHERALKVYDLAVIAAPRDTSLISNRAAIHKYLGMFELAARDYKMTLGISPTDPEALKGLADLTRQSAEGNAVDAMENALKTTPSESSDASTLRLGLAKSYEDMGDYAKSWRHLSAANKIERSRLKYNPDHDRVIVDRLVAGFDRVEKLWPDTTGESPIFIVGMPRTGTTLVERIIGNHSAVHSAGELIALSEAVNVAVGQKLLTTTNWGEYANALSGLDGTRIADEYLERLKARRGVKPRFSDKAPANFFYCALIFRAFPKARIVHLTRHPLAACYAIYKTRFNGGYPFSYDLAELGDFYIGYRKLMAHWHEILPGRIHDVAYEGVVTAQEVTTRALLDYLDLPFEPACLDFHLNPTSTATSSSVQVRQPLYDSSLHQWQHYAEQLAPLQEKLSTAGLLTAG